jgi:effector-binding domain-containing protein
MTDFEPQTPTIESRPAQPYVGIAISAPMKEWGKVNDLVPQVFGWTAQNGLTIAGPLLYRYLIIGDMDKPFDVEVGVVVAEAAQGDGRIKAGEIPAGKYATIMHHGHPDKMVHSYARLEEWAKNEGIRFKTTQENGKEVWAGRFEFFLTNPEEQPDLDQWDMQILYQIEG